jgi:hypothetical protein
MGNGAPMPGIPIEGRATDRRGPDRVAVPISHYCRARAISAIAGHPTIPFARRERAIGNGGSLP